MIACENSGHNVLDDFAEVSKIVEAGATHKSTRDYELSRYACYLIVQNGDPRKEVIALGQTYFAIQTYRQEVADHFNELDEDNRRLVVRGDINPSLTLFRLKIAANADSYCVCGFYTFFREKRNVLRNSYNPLERLIIPAIAFGVVSSLSVLKHALSCNASVSPVLV